MDVTYTSENGRLRFTLDAETAKDAFQQVANLQELFELECCGLCGTKDPRLGHRKHQDYDFFELQCSSANCGATLGFGQRKEDGQLFPRRRDSSGADMPNNGWFIYQQGEQSASSSRGEESQAASENAVPF